MAKTAKEQVSRVSRQASSYIAEVSTNDDNNVGNGPDWDEDDDQILPELESLMEAAIEQEPAVTALLKGIEEEFQGKLSGLDYKCKSRESMLRKIRKSVDRKRVALLNEGKEEEAVDIPKTVWETTDALRYTVLLATERYTAAVKAAMARFAEKGMEANELKNFWPGGDNYQGINDVFQIAVSKSPSGKMLFEIQFHTPESFESKMNSHKFYETFRSSNDPMLKLTNWKALCAAAKKVPLPDGVLQIPHPKSNPNPGELELYCELVLMRNRKNEPAIRAAIESTVPYAERIDPRMLTVDQLIALMKRMVDHEHRNSKALQEATNDIHEALNFRVVLPEENYTPLCQKATWELANHFHFEGCRNGWMPVKEQLTGRAKDTRLGCGLGWVVQLNFAAEDDGVGFTDDDRLPCMVTMHTESSLQVQADMLIKYEQYRTVRTHRERKELAEEIRQMHEGVKVPKDARKLSLAAILHV